MCRPGPPRASKGRPGPPWASLAPQGSAGAVAHPARAAPMPKPRNSVRGQHSLSASRIYGVISSWMAQDITRATEKRKLLGKYTFFQMELDDVIRLKKNKDCTMLHKDGPTRARSTIIRTSRSPNVFSISALARPAVKQKPPPLITSSKLSHTLRLCPK